MIPEETELKPNSGPGSGRVRQWKLADNKTRITQITTFCPDLIGPGPAHLYLIQSDALILLDAGIPTGMAKAFFYHLRNQPIPPDVDALSPDHSEREFHDALRLAGYDIKDIDLLVISHGHLDHFLMAHAIVQSAQCSVAAHILDTPEICNPWGILSMWYGRQQQMRATGMPEPWSAPNAARERMIQHLDLETLGLSVHVDSPIFTDGPLTLKGSEIPGIEVVHVPGHTRGSIGLIVGNDSDKVLMCGDVLLNPITPHPENLLTYLSTVSGLGDRDDIGLVLPAHGDEIRDVRERTDFLTHHHKMRLKLTYESCAEPRCVWDIATMEGYFDTYVDPSKFNMLAGTEALVHMELLSMVDGLRRTHISDQVHYFQHAGEPFEQVYGRIADMVMTNKTGTIMRY